MSLPERLPPKDDNAEQALLGACMLDQGLERDIMAVVQVDDFWRPGHQKIYSAICEAVAETDASDLITVSNVLRSRGDLEDCGGGEYLTACLNELTAGARWPEYARRVRRYARRREIMAWAEGIEQKALDTETDFPELLSDMATDALDFNRDAGEQFQAHQPVETIEEHWEGIEEALNTERSVTPARWGIPKLDEYTGGIGHHHTVLIMAREKIGKTRFATHAALSSAVEFEKMSPSPHVLYCPLEEGRKPWVRNAIAWAAQIDSLNLLPGKCPKHEREEVQRKAAEGLGVIANMPLLIQDRARTAKELVARIEVEHRQHGLGLVVVDYLQLLGHGGDDERIVLMEASQMLSDCAERLGVPIVINSQMSVNPTTGRLLAYGGRGANFEGSLLLKLEREEDEEGNKLSTGEICCVGARHIPEFSNVQYRVVYKRGARYYEVEQWRDLKADEQKQERSKRLNPSGR